MILLALNFTYFKLFSSEVEIMARVKPVFRCKETDKEIFKNSQCLLTISVGQEVHEGEKFAATIELVERSFKSCIMLIDDTLQRHTIALNAPQNADFFFEQSLKEGDLWLLRNEQYYGELTILKKIMRWNDWLNHPNYVQQQQIIKELTNSDPSYKYSFEFTVNEFVTRYHQRLSDNLSFNMERAHQLCFDYLAEECTAMCLWPEINCNFEVYPSYRNLAMDETHKRFVLPSHPTLLHALPIKFKNRKQLKPQSFEVLKNKTFTTLDEHYAS